MYNTEPQTCNGVPGHGNFRHLFADDVGFHSRQTDKAHREQVSSQFPLIQVHDFTPSTCTFKIEMLCLCILHQHLTV